MSVESLTSSLPDILRQPFWLVFFGIIVVLFLTVLSGRSNRKREGSYNYERRLYLFTQAERSFLGVLDLAISDQYRIFGKVRVADVLKVPRGLSRSEWQTAFNKISAKHFDFVLADPKTLEVKYVIELNDMSHRSEKRAERDQFLREACRSADLRLIEVDAKRSYTVAELTTLLVEPAPIIAE